MSLEPIPEDPSSARRRSMGVIGLLIVAVVVAMALVVVMFSPTNTQQASNEPRVSPPASAQTR